MTILRPIWKMTLRTQGFDQDGTHGRLWGVIAAMEYLLSHFEGWKTFNNDPSQNAEFEASQASSIAFSEPGSQPPTYGRGRRTRQACPPSPQPSQESRYTEADLPFHARQEHISKISGFQNLGPDCRQLMRVAINNGLKKLDEYYSLTAESLLYAFDLLLHPAFNLKYLKRNWKSDRKVLWVSDAVVALAEYFSRWYPSEERKMRLFPAQTREPPREPDSFEEWVHAEATIVDDSDNEEPNELERYLQLQRQPGCEPIEWWFEHQGQFPRLSQKGANCSRLIVLFQ